MNMNSNLNMNSSNYCHGMICFDCRKFNEKLKEIENMDNNDSTNVDKVTMLASIKQLEQNIQIQQQEIQVTWMRIFN